MKFFSKIGCLFQTSRLLHTTCACTKNYNRRGDDISNHFLQKMASLPKKSKRNLKWMDNHSSPFQIRTDDLKKSGPSTGTLRRANQLGVVLYKYASDLVNTGELDPLLPELGVKLTKVKMVPNCTSMTVEWEATGTQDDILIEEILLKNAKRLRHMLIQLRVIGQVPPIHFVKDKTSSRKRVVEDLLAVADMGPDHVEVLPGEHMKSSAEESLKYYNKDTFQETINNLTKKFHRIEFQNSYDSVERHGANEIISTQNNMNIIKTDNFEQDKLKEETLNISTLDLKFRSDMYELNHTNLLQKVVHAKNKAKDRNYVMPDMEEDDVKEYRHFTPKDVRKLMRMKTIKTRKPTMPRTYLYEEYSDKEDHEQSIYMYDDEIQDDNSFEPDNFNS